ncbi:hypothetical protein BH23CHL5_BH23CHL5_02040 [soil metagenome]
MEYYRYWRGEVPQDNANSPIYRMDRREKIAERWDRERKEWVKASATWIVGKGYKGETDLDKITAEETLLSDDVLALPRATAERP